MSNRRYIQNLSTQITVLQNKLTLLRSEMYRDDLLNSFDGMEISKGIDKLEADIDALQSKYIKIKEEGGLS